MVSYNEVFENPPPEHDYKRCISNALDTAEQLCMARGAHLTPIRHQVLSLIWESHKAIKAYELLERFKPAKNNAKPATIYRALDFLMEQGLIHRVESMNAFIGCSCSSHRHEQLLLIFKRCHEVQVHPATEVMMALVREMEKSRFIAHSKAIEIHGLCGRCSANPE